MKARSRTGPTARTSAMPPATARRRRLLAVLMALGAGLLGTAALTAEPAQAAPAPAPLSAPLLPIPSFTVPAGSAGTTAFNSSVALACNGGQAVVDQQWYRLPASDLGTVRVVADARRTSVGPKSDPEPAGSAVVDATTGQVVRCGSGLFTVTSARPLALVLFYLQPDPPCDESDACEQRSFRLSLDVTTGVPPVNDQITQATPIGSVPFTTTVDTGAAHADGPPLTDYDNCLRSAIQPVQTSTAWWSYTPTTTGPLPLKAVAVHGGFRPSIAVAEVTSSGPVLVPLADGQDCDSPKVLTAGVPYLIGVFTTYDEYYEAPLTTGGLVQVTIGVPGPPGQPTAVTGSANSAARTATVTWSPPANDGGAPITGYRVSRNGTDTGGTGPWSTVLPATSRSFTFHYLLRDTGYSLTVEAINANGSGPAGHADVVLPALPAPPPLPVVTRLPDLTRILLTLPPLPGTDPSTVTGVWHLGRTLTVSVSLTGSATGYQLEATLDFASPLPGLSSASRTLKLDLA